MLLVRGLLLCWGWRVSFSPIIWTSMPLNRPLPSGWSLTTLLALACLWIYILLFVPKSLIMRLNPWKHPDQMGFIWSSSNVFGQLWGTQFLNSLNMSFFNGKFLLPLIRLLFALSLRWPIRNLSLSFTPLDCVILSIRWSWKYLCFGSNLISTISFIPFKLALSSVEKPAIMLSLCKRSFIPWRYPKAEWGTWWLKSIWRKLMTGYNGV